MTRNTSPKRAPNTRETKLVPFVAPSSPIKRAPGISRRTIPCPDCSAEVGQPCVSASGALRRAPHASRSRMAARKFNALPPPPPPPVTPTCPKCGKAVSLTSAGLVRRHNYCLGGGMRP